MKSHESNKSPMLPKVEALVVRRFKDRQYTAAPDIRAALGIGTGSVGRMIQELLKTHAIVYVGRAFHIKRDDIDRNSALYAPEGTPMLPGVKFNAAAPRSQAKERKPVNKAGSGVVAGGWYVKPFSRLERTPADVYPQAMVSR